MSLFVSLSLGDKGLKWLRERGRGYMGRKGLIKEVAVTKGKDSTVDYIVSLSLWETRG